MNEIERQIRGEEVLIESIINEKFDKNKKITTLCHKNKVKSEYKNDFFDYIHIDQDGKIVDVQLIEETPFDEKNMELNVYWNNLYYEFLRDIEPAVVIVNSSRKRIRED